MADDQNDRPAATGRRGSLAGLFSNGRPSLSRGGTDANNSPPPQQSAPGPISQAAAQAQRRRMSLTTLGLSGSPNGGSPSTFGSYRGRRDSLASSANTDESAIAEDDSPQKEDTGTSPTPFARRTSFGAKALRDRMGSFGGGNAGSNGIHSRSPSGATSISGVKAQNEKRISSGRGSSLALALDVTAPFHSRRTSMLTTMSAPGASGEGFNWSDNFRTRAERGSIVGTSAAAPVGVSASNAGGGHARAKSVATMEPPPAAAMPPPKESRKPDHMQERILKGDFYMD